MKTRDRLVSRGRRSCAAPAEPKSSPYKFIGILTLRPLIIVPGGLITSTGVVLVVLVVVLVVLGVVFLIIAIVACHYFYYYLNQP